MIYREAGQFKSNYDADQAIFPLKQDRWFIAVVLVVLFVAVPTFGDEYFLQAIMIPVLCYSMAAIGLNLLTGYCGQLSLGTGAFMATGAVAAYKLMTAFPELNIIVVFLTAGLITAAVGMIFGIPSLRIKGFYLAVATLAAQFFLGWLYNKVPWFVNYTPSGTITAPPREAFGVLVVVFALVAKNIVRSPIGRSWMAVRDMDIAAELIGFRPFQTKLLAFTVSSFYIGVAGAMTWAVWLGSVETNEAFEINQSFQVLFMIIIGGLGSIMGAFFGAAFIHLMPIALNNFMVDLLGFQAVTAKHLEVIIFGGMIIFFLVVEPLGLARLWQIAKEKLRVWPFPY